MIAQIALSSMLGGIMLYAWTEYRRAPLISMAFMLLASAGLYFIWLPGHATWLAALAGIGRGVDLILYVWVVISLMVLLNLHLKLRLQMELITVLARELALANAPNGKADKMTQAAPIE
jgi:small membrane protein